MGDDICYRLNKVKSTIFNKVAFNRWTDRSIGSATYWSTAMLYLAYIYMIFRLHARSCFNLLIDYLVKKIENNCYCRVCAVKDEERIKSVTDRCQLETKKEKRKPEFIVKIDTYTYGTGSSWICIYLSKSMFSLLMDFGDFFSTFQKLICWIFSEGLMVILVDRTQSELSISRSTR